MPCFLCKNINRGNHHDYAGTTQYFCTVHNEPRDWKSHCEHFEAEAFVGVLSKLLQDYDFYKEKIDYVLDAVNNAIAKTPHDVISLDPDYMLAELEDIKQGLDHNRTEIELLFACMQLWNYTPA